MAGTMFDGGGLTRKAGYSQEMPQCLGVYVEMDQDIQVCSIQEDFIDQQVTSALCKKLDNSIGSESGSHVDQYENQTNHCSETYDDSFLSSMFQRYNDSVQGLANNESDKAPSETVSSTSTPQTQNTFKHGWHWSDGLAEDLSKPMKSRCARRVSRSGQCRSNMREGHNVKSWRSFVQSWKWSTLRGWIFVLLLMVLHAPGVFSQTVDCTAPPSSVSVNETADAGTVVLTLNASPEITWAWTASEPWHNDYLTLSHNGSQMYTLSLLKPLDIEVIVPAHGDSATYISLSLTCTRNRTVRYTTYLIVGPVNEYDPTFNTTSLQVTVNETVPITQVLINLTQWVTDRDLNPFHAEIAAYTFLPYAGDPENDGHSWLKMYNALFGTITPSRQLDYESLPTSRKYVMVGVKVEDWGQRSGTASLTVYIEDDDDLPPEFHYAGCPVPCTVTYSVTVSPNVTGPVTGIRPAPIQARDGDTLNYPVEFHIVQGPQDFDSYISMDSTTGDLSILRELRDLGLADLVLIVEAREVSVKKLSTRTTLLIAVDGVAEVDPVASASTGDDTVMIVAIVLAIIVVLIVVALIIVTLYFRKKFKKPIHPDPSPPKPYNDGEVTAASTPRDYSRQPTIRLSDDEQVRGEEELTWVPITAYKDIVDLSDEDTLRMKKKNGIPPSSTELTNRDSAFEESDKKSGSDDSPRHQDDYPETEYAEVDTPPEKRKDPVILTRSSDLQHANKMNHTYNNTPSNRPATAADNEYVTPKEAATPAVFYNRVYQDHEGTKMHNGTATEDDQSEGVTSFSSHGDGENEVTGYSVPPSGRTSHSNRPLPIPEDEAESRVTSIDFAQQRPNLRAEPRVKVISGLKIPEEFEEPEDHYATVDKKKGSPTAQAENGDADHSALSSSADNSPKSKATPMSVQAPVRRKRPRKRPKASRDSDEEIFDGTKDYENAEVDSGFYTDTTKARIKRSSRLPVMKPDPNDTRYWITVTSDY